ncbi:hypothetical protein TSUD_110280 [Trifolium subterraneum]|uniref:Uncharacterized protein n=1 Tax=Trifolium subterraneum TaxID=3900 RepID=A0A2Z6LYD0_TRISU|nr:hypothetical protein TSUD_110280 [Trifolium subterraneum]
MENGDQFQESKAKYNCLLFGNLDDTLYPFSSGLSGHVTKNIQEYMLEKLGIQEDKVPQLPNADIVLPKTPVVCKPFADSFEKVFKMADIDPQRTLFFDDSIRNIKTGKSLGLHTVLVGTSIRTTGVDHALESIHNMREAFPELWEADEKSESDKYSRKVAIETSVIA